MPPLGPPVRFHSTQVSTVQKERFGSSGPRARSPCSRSQAALVALKYGSSTRPGRGADEGEVAVGDELRAERRGAPVLPHDGAVQRPAGAAVEGDERLALVGDADGGDGLGGRLAASARRAATSARVARTAAQISSGSCSTQPGRGKCWVSSR